MNRNRIKIYIIIVSLFLSTEVIQSKNYNFRNFSIKDGLPDAIITSTIQTKDGFIYFTTTNGLSKFDGKKAINFNIIDGLPHSNIEFALEYEPNKLLLATFGGLSLFDGNSFTNYSTQDGLVNDTVYTLFKDKDRYLIGTQKGISIFTNGKFINSPQFDFFKDFTIHAFEYDDGGSLVIGTNNGLFKYTDEKIVAINDSILVLNLFLNNDNTLWCGAVEGAFTYKNNTFSADSNLTNKSVYSIISDNNNQIWFGTLSGITKKYKDEYTFYGTTNYFHGREIYNIYQDRELNLWFATNHGAYIFDDGKFILYDRRDGITSSAWSILERSNGNIWVATDGNIVLELDGDKFSEIPMLSELPKTVWNLYEDKNNNIWFCTSNGAFRLDTNNSLIHFSSKNGFTDDMIIGITEDNNGILWFTSFKSGVFKYDGNSFVQLKLKNSNSSPIFGAVNGFDNCLWFFSGSGIDRVCEMKNLDFPDQELLNEYSYYSLTLDNNGNYLLGTFERGLIIYNPKNSSRQERIKYINTKDGLSNNSILFLKFDDNDSTLWIGTNKGLNKLDYQKFINSGIIDIKSFNEYDGFPSAECHQFGAFIDSKGFFWFSTKQGLVIYDKRKEIKRNFVSKAFISSLEINYKNVNLKDFGTWNDESSLKYDNISFPYNMNNITFHYSSLYYTNPLDILYSYRLLGSNEAFSPFTKNEYVTFSALSPGNYTFELISFTEDGNKPSLPVQFSFTINAPFWKSNLFVTILIFSFMLTIYTIYRVRTTEIRKRNFELLKLNRQNLSYQNQLIESEKDYKGLFENAHNAILIIDTNSLLIMDANNSAVKLYDYQKSELIGLSVKVLEVDQEKTKELLNEVRQNKNIKNYSTIHLKKNGDEVKLSVNANFINFKGKKALISVHRDITQEEETKAQLLSAKIAAEKSNKLKSEFLAQISHEIRTPINTILGFVTLIISEFETLKSENIHEYYVPIKRSTDRLIRTVDLILNTSDVVAGTFELEIKENDIANILENIVIEHMQSAKDKNLTLSFIKKVDAKLSIDYNTFCQIFINLIDNAIKYTHEGNIDVVLFKENDKTIVEIIDTGIGISKEFIPNMFEPFTQEEQGYTRKFDGNGLGLALVKNYVQINKGEISVISKKGYGTTFRVEF